MLIDVASLTDRQVDEKIGTLSSLCEPLVIIVLGDAGRRPRHRDVSSHYSTRQRGVASQPNPTFSYAGYSFHSCQKLLSACFRGLPLREPASALAFGSLPASAADCVRNRVRSGDRQLSERGRCIGCRSCSNARGAKRSAKPPSNRSKTTACRRAITCGLPRSACPHCGHVLRAWENLPVLSYLLLRGRCSACKTPVVCAIRCSKSPAPRCAAGALAVFGPTGMALAAFGLCAALLAMSAIDIDTHLLPDSLTLPLLWAGLIVNFNGMFASLHDAVLGAIFGLSCAVGRALAVQARAWRRRNGLWGLQTAGRARRMARLGRVAADRADRCGRRGGRRPRGNLARPHALRGAAAIRAFLAAGGAITLFLGTPLYLALGG